MDSTAAFIGHRGAGKTSILGALMVKHGMCDRDTANQINPKKVSNLPFLSILLDTANAMPCLKVKSSQSPIFLLGRSEHKKAQPTSVPSSIPMNLLQSLNDCVAADMSILASELSTVRECDTSLTSLSLLLRAATSIPSLRKTSPVFFLSTADYRGTVTAERKVAKSRKALCRVLSQIGRLPFETENCTSVGRYVALPGCTVYDTPSQAHYRHRCWSRLCVVRTAVVVVRDANVSATAPFLAMTRGAMYGGVLRAVILVTTSREALEKVPELQQCWGSSGPPMSHMHCDVENKSDSVALLQACAATVTHVPSPDGGRFRRMNDKRKGITAIHEIRGVVVGSSMHVGSCLLGLETHVVESISYFPGGEPVSVAPMGCIVTARLTPGKQNGRIFGFKTLPRVGQTTKVNCHILAEIGTLPPKSTTARVCGISSGACVRIKFHLSIASYELSRNAFLSLKLMKKSRPFSIRCDSSFEYEMGDVMLLYSNKWMCLVRLDPINLRDGSPWSALPLSDMLNPCRAHVRSTGASKRQCNCFDADADVMYPPFDIPENLAATLPKCPVGIALAARVTHKANNMSFIKYMAKNMKDCAKLHECVNYSASLMQWDAMSELIKFQSVAIFKQITVSSPNNFARVALECSAIKEGHVEALLRTLENTGHVTRETVAFYLEAVLRGGLANHLKMYVGRFLKIIVKAPYKRAFEIIVRHPLADSFVFSFDAALKLPDVHPTVKTVLTMWFSIVVCPRVAMLKTRYMINELPTPPKIPGVKAPPLVKVTPDMQNTISKTIWYWNVMHCLARSSDAVPYEIIVQIVDFI